MKTRNLLLTFLGITALGLLVVQSPQKAQASLQACNPTISSISGTSNVWGVPKNMSVNGPGQDVAGGGGGAPAPAFQSTETVQGGGLDATSGMSYRGNGLWQDNLGNQLQLAIHPTRAPTPPAILGCDGWLTGPVTGLFGSPGGIGSGTNQQVEIIGDWLITNTNGPGQKFGLRALISVNVVPQPATPTPTPTPTPSPAPILSASTPTCNASQGVYQSTLTWMQVATNAYQLYANGQPSGGRIIATANSLTVNLSPGQSTGYMISAVNTNSQVPSNVVNVSASSQPCPPTPTPTPPFVPAPGPFTVSAQTSCLSSTTVRVTLSWTPSNNSAFYTLGYKLNGPTDSPVSLMQANALTYQYTEPAGIVSTRYYVLSANGSGGWTMASQGTGVIAAPAPNATTVFGVTLPNCAPAIPGAFSGTITMVCQGTNPVAKLNWTNASGATAYNVFDVGTPGSSSPLGTLTSPPSPSPDGFSVGSLRQNLRFHIVASNDGGVSEIFLPQDIANQPTMPDCSPPPVPVPTITLATVNSICSAGSPANVLTWTSSDGVTGALSDFSVFRDSDATPIATSATSPYTDSAVTNGTAHTYKVTSGTTEATIDAPATNCPQLPPQPTLIAATECNSDNTAPINQLSWFVASRGATSDDSYQVLRDGQQIGTTITQPAPHAASDPTDTIHFAYNDNTVSGGETHSYIIKAINLVGISSSVPQNLVAKTCTPTPVATNQPPVAYDDSATTPQDTAIAIDVLANDTDPDGQVVPSCTKVTTQPVHGTTSVDTANGKITYTPTNGYTGADAFIYEICDDKGAKDTATVTITVTAVNVPAINHPPVANDDSATTKQDTAVTIPVLSNDTDPDNNLDPASLKVTQNPTNGTVNLTTDHQATYTPKAGFSGTDTFTYEVCDTGALCDTAIVTVTITAAVLPGPLTLSVQPLCIGSQTAQNVLTWSASDKATGYIVRRDTQTLTPSPITSTNYVDTSVTQGTTYNYIIDAKNTDGTTSSAPVSIKTGTCTPVANNLPPQANDDVSATDQNSFVVIDVLLNDTDPDGQVVPSCTKVVVAPTHGTTIVDTTNGKIAYTPTKDFNGTDTFIYEICDDKGATSTAKVTITVKPPVPVKVDKNTPPQANDDAAVTPHNKPVDIDILLNDTDTDGNLDPACVKITKQPGHGTVAINATSGRATYTPANGFSGTDTFQYTVCDKLAAVSNVATVSNAVGQAPPSALASTGIPILGFIVDLWNKFLALIGLR